MTAVYQVALMSLLIFLGFICVKAKIITSDGTKTLSVLVSLIANPATVFISFQIEYSAEKMAGLFYAFILTIIAFIVSYIVAFAIIRGKNREQTTAERIAAIYPNSGFMGIPLVRGVFGDEGVFYLAVYLAVFNLLIWTVGEIQIRGKADKKDMLNLLTNPSIIAVFIGFVLFVTQIKLPRLAVETIGYLADLTTPTAMLVAGALIAAADLPTLIRKNRAYYTTFTKLLVIPCVVYGVFLFLPIDDTVKSIILAAVACPTGALSVILAAKHNKESIYAAELFAMTTVLSTLTLPLTVNLPFGVF